MTIKKTILGAIGNKFFNQAVIVSANKPSDAFVILDLQSSAFVGLGFNPGDKIQLNVGDWEVRTYTPISLDPESGVMKIMAYIHGSAPGAKWALNAKCGDTVKFMGPKSSLASPELHKPLIIFGDETSIPMAATFQKARGDSITKCVFEVNDIELSSSGVEALNLKNVQYIKKSENKDSLLEAISHLISETGSPSVILSGNAQTIQTVRSHLKKVLHSFSEIKTKAYWSEGRVGLD